MWTRLCSCVSSGIPQGEGLRSRAWQLLLNYLPTKRASWPDVLTQRRAEYSSFCRDFAIRPSDKDTTPVEDHPLSTDDDSSWNSYFKDQQYMEQIEIDVDRTQQDEDFFCEHEHAEQHRKKVFHAKQPDGAGLQEIKRALFIHAKLNPGLKYVQGMNELLAPLYYVFKTDAATPEDAVHAEADAFFCFIQLMEISEARDLYCKVLDRTQSGTNAKLQECASFTSRPLHA